MDQAIRRIAARHGRLSVAIETVAGDDDLYALGLTSHTAVNVMLTVEDRFAIKFSYSCMTKSTFATVDSLSAAVREHGGACRCAAGFGPGEAAVVTEPRLTVELRGVSAERPPGPGRGAARDPDPPRLSPRRVSPVGTRKGAAPMRSCRRHER